MSDGPARSRLAATAVLGALWALLPAALGFLLLANLGAASDWLRSHPGTGLAAFVAIFAVTSGLGLLPTYAQAVLGGWVFRLAGGVPAALAGFTGGALLGYAVSRLVGREALRQRIDQHPKAHVIREALVGHGFWRTLGTVTLLRLPPNSPFALTNLAMAGSGVRLLPFLVGTILGMAPRTAVMVGLGAAGAASGARDIGQLVQERSVWQIAIGVGATIVVLMVLAAIGKHALKRAGMA